MPTFKEGCVVAHRPTSLVCTVIRWDQEDKLLLVRPIRLPSDSGTASTKLRKRTRWVFEKAVVLVERTKNSSSTTATTTTATAFAKRSASASGGTSGQKMPPPVTDFDLTEHARRSTKLDHRVEIREDRDHPKRGRGLFAVQPVPEGTEVMRVQAVGAVVVRPFGETLCCRCFRRSEKDDLIECRNCHLRLCDACHSGDAENRPHWTRCEFARKVLLFTANPEVDEGTLRLSADILARKKAGEINDKDWDLMNSLRSDNNEAGDIGLSTRHLKTGVRIFKDTMDMEVSEEDIQTMYRRVTRNAHTVSPGETNMAFGHVQGVFPFGSLVNHSCRPNSCFHSVAKASPQGPEVELVLRTTREVHVGDELCISYLVNYPEIPVARRRELLEGWGFQCACARCHAEAEEEKHPEKHAKPRNQEARKMLNKITEMVQQGVRSKQQGGQDKQRVLTTTLELLTHAGEDMSPILRACLTMEVTALASLCKEECDAVAMLAVFRLASDTLVEFRDPRAIDVLFSLHHYARVIVLQRGASDSWKEQSLAVARHALAKAADMCDLYFGKQHDRSIAVRKAQKTALTLGRVCSDK